MEMSELSKAIAANAEWYEKKHNVEVDVHFAAYNLIKEIGQFADSILLSQGRARASRLTDDATAKGKITQELVDIIALALINADLYDIDIESEMIARWVNKTGT